MRKHFRARLPSVGCVAGCAGKSGAGERQRLYFVEPHGHFWPVTAIAIIIKSSGDSA
jgi:hypothetical protein